MLHFVVWVWGSKYGPEYIDRLRAGILRNCGERHRLIVAEPCAGDMFLTSVPGCFARLRTFDPAWQAAMDIPAGGRIVSLDLDNVITGPLDGLFDRPEPFCILQGVNASNPCRYNGSLWMLRAGYRPDVWSDFSLEKAAGIPAFAFPDDQLWFAEKVPGAGEFGPATGVYGFKKPGWPNGDALPENARIVAFFGHRDPSQFTHVPWVRKHWLG